MSDVNLPGRTIGLLITTFLLSLYGHTDYMAWWFYSLGAFVSGWRFLVHRGFVSYPRGYVKAFAVVLASAAVYTSTGKQFSLEAGSGFLVAGGMLKVLELSTRRDAVVLVFLSLFCLATGFLFRQDVLSGFVGMIILWLNCVAMISAQGALRSGSTPELPVLKISAMLMVASVPFMLAVYFVFPRLGPLWSVALQSEAGFSALSDSMRPGQISQLTQSSDTAFRVTFDGERPPQRDLYWRAMTLDFHNGEYWEQSPLDQQTQAFPGPVFVDAGGRGPVYSYEVIQEPTAKNYLFSLAGTYSAELPVEMSVTGLAVSNREVYQRIAYRLDSTLKLSPRLLAQGNLYRYLKLPLSGNPKVREWAQSLPDDAQGFARAFFRVIAEGQYYYTLKPPLYPDNEVDRFLFDGKRGFCEHYASAMVYAARANGIPARLVAGYQGGEWHPDGYLTVRQYDAHAWAELWNGNNWIQVDPTAAVAPERISSGLRQALAAEDTFLSEQLLSVHRLQDLQWLNAMRLQWDSLNYIWSRWVLSYDGGRQAGLLKDWFGIKDLLNGLYLLAGLIALTFLTATVVMWWQHRPEAKPALVLAFDRLQQCLRAYGADVHGGTSPLTLLDMAATILPDERAACDDLKLVLSRLLYSGEGFRSSREEHQQIRYISKRIRLLTKGVTARHKNSRFQQRS
ncbi:MAG: DUF3488 and transglutaminase-like domain-containing protein [Thalassolituus sp.]